MRRRLLVALASLCIVPLFAGCTISSTSTEPTTSRTATTTATATPTATPKAVAERIELGPEFTRALAGDGTELWRIGYDDDPAAVVRTISETLGTPTTSEHAGAPSGDYDLSATDYDWTGLELRSPHYNGAQPKGDGYSDYVISATAPTSHGFELVTSSGVRVGMSRAELSPIAARYTGRPSPSSPEVTYLENWTRDHDGDPITDWIAVRLDGDAVARIYATVPSYGA